MQHCYGCMKEYGKEYDVCPYCGYVVGTKPESKSHLLPGTVLAGRYTVGKAIGHGGFGITYIAWDDKLQKTVAVKEYFPNAFSTRSEGDTQISCLNADAERFFTSGVKKMLDEARRLSSFSKNENIVDIYDFFEGNNTAYIVMEYLEGKNLKQYLEENGGKLAPEKAVELIMPVLNALEDMHKEHLIHRDISPDNIYLCNNGKVKLLDFGSARLASEESEKSLSVMLKRGYAPKEQYSSRAKQGTWTDVYAVCATLYKMITGETPVESTDRDDEELKTFSELGINGCDELEKVILKGMEIKPADRMQSVQELRAQLSGAGKSETKKEPEKQENQQPQKVKKHVNKKIIVAAVAAVVLIIVAALVLPKIKLNSLGTESGAEKNTSYLATTEDKQTEEEITREDVRGAYQSFLEDDKLKETHPIIAAFLTEDMSLLNDEHKAMLEFELLQLKNLSSAVVDKKYIDLDSDGVEELLLSADVNGEGFRVCVYLFDIDEKGKVFEAAAFEGLAPGRLYNHLAVMQKDGRYSFVVFSNDGNFWKSCEKYTYNGKTLERKLSLAGYNYAFTDGLGGVPKFEKCVLSDRTLYPVSNVDAYPSDNQVEKLSYKDFVKEWNSLYDGEVVAEFCCNASIAKTDAVKVIGNGKVNDKIMWSLYETGMLIVEGTGAIPDYSDEKTAPWKDYSDQILYVVIADDITTIGSYAFSLCDKVVSVKIGEGVSNIGKCAFYNCSSLSSAEISDNVSVVDEFAFYYCVSLTSITIGKGVTSIKDGAFWRCSSLEEVFYRGNQEQWNDIDISENNKPLTNANINCNS